MKRGFIVATVAVIATLAMVAMRRDATEPAAAAAPAPTGTASERLAAVERVIAERNREAGEETQRFIADGWEMVAAEEPEHRLLAFDPALLAEGREEDLRIQLGSTTPTPAHARAVAQIAVLAKDPATREAATEALGRINTDHAREELIGLLTGGKLHPDDMGRRQISAYLRPSDLHDPAAARIAGLLDHPALTDAERQQVAFNLALVGLRDGMSLPADVLATMSPGALALLDQMTKLGGEAFLAHTHKHHDQ
jgi:hypothetical protein